MLIAKVNPGDWLHFIERKDNKGLSILELKEKYRDEKILFENYITNLDQHKLMIAQMSAGGSVEEKTPPPPPTFIMRVVIPTAGFTFKVNLTKEGGATGYNIDWGDGNIEDGNGTPSHVYAASGTYDIRIISDMDKIEQLTGGVTADMSATITHILNWGDVQWSSTNQMFRGCTNLISLPSSSPDLSNVTDMGYMFASCTNFDYDISKWDVSNVVDMDQIFAEAISFDQNIGNWDVSNVTNMSGMFYSTSNFNQDIGGWDTSSVNNMDGMFILTTLFSQDIGGWDVGSLRSALQMFYASGMTTANYDSLLIGWANSPRQQNVGFTSDLTYSSAALSARTTLVNTPWTISDGGQV